MRALRVVETLTPARAAVRALPAFPRAVRLLRSQERLERSRWGLMQAMAPRADELLLEQVARLAAAAHTSEALAWATVIEAARLTPDGLPGAPPASPFQRELERSGDALAALLALPGWPTLAAMLESYNRAVRAGESVHPRRARALFDDAAGVARVNGAPVRLAHALLRAELALAD